MAGEVLSLKSLGAQAEIILAGMTAEHRGRALAVVREVVSAYRAAFDVLPAELMTVFALGSVELIVKAKAGWKLEPMIHTVMKAAPTLVELINELRRESDARMELRPETTQVRVEGGSDRLGPAPPDVALASSFPRAAPASTAPARRRRWFG